VIILATAGIVTIGGPTSDCAWTDTGEGNAIILGEKTGLSTIFGDARTGAGCNIPLTGRIS